VQKGDWFIYVKFREETGKRSQLITKGPNGGNSEKELREAFEKLKEKDQEEGLGVKYADLCEVG